MNPNVIHDTPANLELVAEFTAANGVVRVSRRTLAGAAEYYLEAEPHELAGEEDEHLRVLRIGPFASLADALTMIGHLPTRDLLSRRDSHAEPPEYIDHRFAISPERRVYLEQAHVVSHYSGHLEGSPETVSTHTLELIPNTMKRLFGSNVAPLHVVGGTIPLPAYLVACELESDVVDPSIKTDPDAFCGSRLYLVFFTDDLAKSLVDHIRDVFTTLEWDAVARDWEWSM